MAHPNGNGAHAVPNGTNSTNGVAHEEPYDVVVVGGGFGGCYALWKFRELGFRVHLIEAGSAFGGVWHWNSYPGARVDSEMPYYQLTIPQVWKSFSWSQRFPGHEELKKYFRHVDKVLNLSKDSSLNTVVVGADFDAASSRWTISTNTGRKITCKYFLPATGSSHKAYKPHFEGLESFKGQSIHTADWPVSGSAEEFRGKKVALIGSGATGVQCVQELSKVASHLTVYMRNPNIALPMGQRETCDLEIRSQKAFYRSLFKLARDGDSGIAYDPCPHIFADHGERERREQFEELWGRGGFSFQSANYQDFLVNQEANNSMYDFWAENVRKRIRNQEKRDIVAPLEPPFPFATKRSSLEQDFFDSIDRDNVELVNLKKTPIRKVTATGIIVDNDGAGSSGGTGTDERTHDTIIMATGFDNVTGTLTSMGLRGSDGIDLKEKWKQGVWTHLGLMTRTCPNMFIIYGPQAPTSFTNAPIFIEAQIDYIADVIMKMEKEGITSIEPRHESEVEWKKVIQDFNDATLMRFNKSSWYLGTNIPGKPREQLLYLGGMRNYAANCRDALKDWSAWDVV